METSSPDRIAVEAKIIDAIYPFLPRPTVYRSEAFVGSMAAMIQWFKSVARHQPIHDVQPIHVPALAMAASTVYGARDERGRRIQIALKIIRRGADAGGLWLRADKLPADMQTVVGQIVPLNADPQRWPTLAWGAQQLRQGAVISKDAIGFDLSRVAWGARFGAQR